MLPNGKVACLFLRGGEVGGAVSRGRREARDIGVAPYHTQWEKKIVRVRGDATSSMASRNFALSQSQHTF